MKEPDSLKDERFWSKLLASFWFVPMVNHVGGGRDASVGHADRRCRLVHAGDWLGLGGRGLGGMRWLGFCQRLCEAGGLANF